MSTVQSRIAIIGVLSLCTLFSGIWLSNSGKPINGIIFNIHKLIALATVLLLAVTVFQSRAGIGPQVLIWAAIIVTGLLFLALFITGALLSIIQPTNRVILTIHSIVPLLVVVFTVLTIYLMANGKS